MKLSYLGLSDRASWEAVGVVLPKYDWLQVGSVTLANPVWLHFGAGNIFRCFIAGLQSYLLDEGLTDRGLIAAEMFDFEIIDRVYSPHDSMTLMVSLKPDGTTDKSVIALIVKGVKSDDREALRKVFVSPSLQLMSYTITEKGYSLRGMTGELLPAVKADIASGPSFARHAMSLTASLLHERYLAGGFPIAVVSIDNCSRNGDKLRGSVLEIVQGWSARGLVERDFTAWLSDADCVSFPLSMIDKITPRPAVSVSDELTALGIEEMEPVVMSRGTYIAPFVNAEAPGYLVIEDAFPNGRPPLDKAPQVYLTDRETVNKAERMKVTTCLNPLHTALAVYGCLLGYELIADEMADPELWALVERIGYKEGLPVVTDPAIISPRAFIDEVITQRLPNPFMPDTPQRIATDTSQKIPVRFGETLKSYEADPELSPASLVAIPLVLAGWLRYLLGVDDKGEVMQVSPDPMLSELQTELRAVKLGEPASADGALPSILDNSNLFGVSLQEVGLSEKVSEMFRKLLKGRGAVRVTLREYLQ